MSQVQLPTQGLTPISYQTHTFGCKVNTYDTGLIQKNLNQQGMKQDQSKKPESLVHVLNTCAVTAEASKEAVRLIRKIKSGSPFAKIVVTGCAAQVDTDLFESLPSVDLIVANSHKSQLPFLIQDLYNGKLTSKVFKQNIFKKEDLEEGGGIEESHSRIFLKIQDGCNSFCSYCVIPFARGKSRSLSIQSLVQRVNDLYSQNFREVVLTGIHIGDYEDIVRGQSLKLEDLIESLLKLTKMPRFRISSLEPVEVSERLLDLYQDPRLVPHFHMSIQSANTQVLQQMRRNYSQKEVMSALNQIAKKVSDVYVGMDVIVGFPSESHEDFEDTYLTLSNLPWTKIHVFPYSHRPGTRATKIGQDTHANDKSRRAERLRELSLHRMNEAANAQIGKTLQCLMLHKKDKQGRTAFLSRNNWNIFVPTDVHRLHIHHQHEELRVKISTSEINARGEVQLFGVLND
ncbi:MAG: tRNA (N(6)-L-threonylcarbamoyladenosine(37)-C(2))-methylthiotransferase MtaB [Pseudobdellovibrionaceae bacterium]